MPTDNRLCVFNPTTKNIVDLLHPSESEVEALLRLAQDELDLVVLPLDEAWQRHENATKRPPVKIIEGHFPRRRAIRL